jgi:hypothetical protein
LTITHLHTIDYYLILITIDFYNIFNVNNILYYVNNE